MRTLSEQQSQILRDRHPYWPDYAAITEVAHTAGWEEANRRYLKGERDRAVAPMRDLMDLLGIAAPVDPATALDLIELASRVFTPEGEFSGTIEREGLNRLRVTCQPCPGFLRLEEQNWLGVTACSSWHRRHGWYDAMGIVAQDFVEADMGLGDPACVAVIEVEGSRTGPGAIA